MHVKVDGILSEFSCLKMRNKKKNVHLYSVKPLCVLLGLFLCSKSLTAKKKKGFLHI